MEVYGIIYQLRNKVNNKSYVGLTTRTIHERFTEHSKTNSYIGKAIRKHGKENFELLEIDNAINEQELKDKEKYWIGKLNTYENGYNLTLGGDGVLKRGKHYFKPTLNDKQKQFIKMAETLMRSRNENKTYWSLNDLDMVVILLHMILTSEDRRLTRRALINLLRLKEELLLFAKSFNVIDGL